MIFSVVYRYSKSVSIIDCDIYIYIYIYREREREIDICRVFGITFLRDLPLLVEWFIEIYRVAIIKELSIRQRLRIFVISWGQKTHVKHCYVNLSSWFEFWFAICIGINIILDCSTAIQQFQRWFRYCQQMGQHGRIFVFIEIRQGIILSPMCHD